MPTKSTVSLRPLGDRVVVKPSEKEENVSASGIIISMTGDKQAPIEGKVVAVGPGRIGDDNERVPMEVKVGDRVIFKKPWDEPMKIDGVEYYVLPESDITAVRN